MEGRPSNDPLIKLNVGGKLFQTHKSVLLPSAFFAALLSGRYNEKVGATIHIDRDPKHFRHVLALLRDTQHPFPEDLAYELEFYGIRFKAITDPPKPTKPKASIDSGEWEAILAHSDTPSSAPLMQLASHDHHIQPKKSLEEPNWYSHWAHKSTHLLYRHNTAACHNTITPTYTSSNTSIFVLHRLSDIIIDLYLTFDAETFPIDNIALFCDTQLSDKLTADFLELYDLIHTDPRIVKARSKVKSKRVLRLPFSFCGQGQHTSSPFSDYTAPLFLLFTQLTQVSIRVTWNPKVSYSNPTLAVHGAFLDDPERKKLLENPLFGHPFWIHRHHSGALKPGLKAHSTRIQFDKFSNAHRIYWAVRGFSGSYIPIKHTRITLNNIHWVSMSRDVAHEHMFAQDPPRGLQGLPVYCLELGPACVGLHRITNFLFDITLEEPLGECAKLIVSTKCQNKMLYGYGLVAIQFPY